MLGRFVLAVALFSGGAEAATLAQAQAKKYLDAEELRRLSAGTTWVLPNNNTAVYNSPDGRRVLRRPNGAVDAGGRWWITADNRFCSSIPSVRQGAESCSYVEAKTDGTYVMMDFNFVVEPGDPHKLAP